MELPGRPQRCENAPPAPREGCRIATPETAERMGATVICQQALSANPWNSPSGGGATNAIAKSMRSGARYMRSNEGPGRGAFPGRFFRTVQLILRGTSYQLFAAAQGRLSTKIFFGRCGR